MLNFVLTVIFLLLNVLLNSLASILLKISSKHSFSGIEQIIKLISNPFFVSGLISFGLSFIAYNVVLKYMNVNIAYPVVVSGSIILVTILSKVFLKEPTNLIQSSGIIIIVLGVIILAMGNMKFY